MKLTGRRALVTGASSGIGAEFARDLAARGCDLIVTARRRDRLEALAAELRAAHSVEVEVLTGDLADPDGSATLHRACKGRDVSILINNAGFGDYHRFGDVGNARIMQMVQLNVTSLADLTHRFVGDFQRRSGRSYILNVGSMVAWLPIANLGAYCGTKAFVGIFSEALASELKGTDVSVTCLSPGGTRTEFTDVAGQSLPPIAEKSLMSAERCAKIGIRAMLKGKRNVVPGFSNKLVIFLTRLIPRRAIAAIARRFMGDVPAPAPAVSKAERPMDRAAPGE